MRFGDLALRAKLQLVIGVTTLGSLLVTSAGHYVFDHVQSRESFRHEAIGAGRLIAENSAAALFFGDAEQAEATLRSLSALPSIEAAALYDAEGGLLARYGASEHAPETLPSWETGYVAGAFVARLPVSRGEETAGTLVLRQSLEPLAARLRQALAIIGGVALGAAVVALLVANFLGRLVSGPILALHRAVQRLAATNDYSVSLEPSGRDEVGALIKGFNGLVRQLRERDEALRGAAASLERRVEERTEALSVATREAESAAAEAHAANKAKSDFLATMSHEIRTPLNAVIGLSSLLLDSSTDPVQKDYLKTVRNSGDSLLALINDILDFSKIEAGRTELEEIEFDLEELVTGCVEMMASRAQEKGLGLVHVIATELPTRVRGDETRIRQILINLVGNALKFTAEGEVRILVSREPESEPGAVRVKFAVEDTGIGISESARARLFKPFSQVDGSTTRRFGGTGLGLAISRRLAELMGGTMGVESVEGEGSVFFFHVLVRSVGEVAAPVRADGGRLRGTQLLVWDSNPLDRRQAANVAHRLGMECETMDALPDLIRKLDTNARRRVLLVDWPTVRLGGRLVQDELRRACAVGGGVIVGLVPFGRSGERGDVDLPAVIVPRPLRSPALEQAFAQALGLADAKERVVEKVGSRERLAEEFPMRILIAEDNHVNQKVLGLILGRLGYRADVAGNGLEALEALKRARYDLVFMDVCMPEMDGLEATEAIRRLECEGTLGGVGAPRMPIIGLTANATLEDRRRCIAAGMDTFLSKPVKPAEIERAIRESIRAAEVA
jgi:signal transduction histidine kinase/CheY-like chemotaxis protein